MLWFKYPIMKSSQRLINAEKQSQQVPGSLFRNRLTIRILLKISGKLQKRPSIIKVYRICRHALNYCFMARKVLRFWRKLKPKEMGMWRVPARPGQDQDHQARGAEYYQSAAWLIKLGEKQHFNKTQINVAHFFSSEDFHCNIQQDPGQSFLKQHRMREH